MKIKSSEAENDSIQQAMSPFYPSMKIKNEHIETINSQGVFLFFFFFRLCVHDIREE